MITSVFADRGIPCSSGYLVRGEDAAEGFYRTNHFIIKVVEREGPYNLGIIVNYPDTHTVNKLSDRPCVYFKKPLLFEQEL